MPRPALGPRRVTLCAAIRRLVKSGFTAAGVKNNDLSNSGYGILSAMRAFKPCLYRLSPVFTWLLRLAKIAVICAVRRDGNTEFMYDLASARGRVPSSLPSYIHTMASMLPNLDTWVVSQSFGVRGKTLRLETHIRTWIGRFPPSDARDRRWSPALSYIT